MIKRLPPSLLASAVVLAASLGMLGWTLARAVTVERAVGLTRAPRRLAQPPAPAIESRAAALSAAVNADPFRADRRRPPRRFVLPGSLRPARVSVATPTLVLSGTVVYPNGGGVAAVRVAGGTGTQLVRVGESIQGLTLRAVAPGEAVFARANGTTLVLRVPKAGG